MSLELSIKVCVETGCTSLQITDDTNVYSVGNTGGWGSPNIEGSDVVSAELLITQPSGDVVTEDVTAQIPSTVTGDIIFTSVDAYSKDGIYKINYVVTTNSTSYQYTLNKLLLCNTRCCIDKMWVNLMEKICDSCDYEKELKNVLLAEALLGGLKAQGACINTSYIENTLERLEQLCEINDCNCE
jgi:hypothetical protein